MSILRRLWQGQYSLPIAFWVFYWAGLVACFIASGFVIVLSESLHARSVAFAVCLTLTWFYMVVASVGVWRSAAPYWTSPIWMRRIWAAAARLIIVGWIAKIAFGLANGGALALVRGIAGDIDF